MAIKKYKALLSDIDGTLMVNKIDALPSARVCELLRKAADYVHVGVATSRPFAIAKPVLDHLKLVGPSMFCGGAQIIDPSTTKVFWERPIELEDIPRILTISQKHGLKSFVADDSADTVFDKHYIPHKPFDVYFPALTDEVAEALIADLSKIPRIVAHKIKSWEDGRESVVATHAEATKQHGIFEVAKILRIETHEIIGIGDGYNDFPLLMACGLKVAMGNAPDDLKAIADYIAPSVEEDGVADVIEKFVLQ